MDREHETGMSNQNESQGMRESVVGESAVSGSWDPYEVWLNRVKKPRDGVASAAMAAAVVVPPMKVAADLSETARLRTLSLPAA